VTNNLAHLISGYYAWMRDITVRVLINCLNLGLKKTLIYDNRYQCRK